MLLFLKYIKILVYGISSYFSAVTFLFHIDWVRDKYVCEKENENAGLKKGYHFFKLKIKLF